MAWLIEILKVNLEEQLPIKSYMIMQLILLKIQNIMDTNVELRQGFTNFLIKSFLELILQVKLLSTQINLLLKVK